MVKIKFLGNFREITREKEKEFQYSGNLAEFLEIMTSSYDSKFKETLFEKDGKIKDYMKILVNGEDLKSENFDSFSLNEEDEIVIFQTIAGG